MAGTDFDVRVNLEAGQAQQQMQQVERGLMDIEGAAGKVNKGFDLLGSAVTGFTTALSGAAINAAQQAISGLFNSIKTGINQASEIERTLGGIQGLIDNTGGSAGKTAAELDRFAIALGEATLTSRQEVLEASRALLSFTSITGENFERTIKLAQDVAETMGGDLVGSTVQLAKALEEPTTGLGALSRSGIQFTEQQKDLIKALDESGDKAAAQAEIFKAVEAQYKGAGEAAAQGLAGALDTLGERQSQILTQIGEQLSPALTDLVNAFSNAAQEALDTGAAQQIARETGEALSVAVENLASALENVDMVQFANDISNATTGAIELFSALGNVIGKLAGLQQEILNTIPGLEGLLWVVDKIYGRTIGDSSRDRTIRTYGPLEGRARNIALGAPAPDASSLSTPEFFNASNFLPVAPVQPTIPGAPKPNARITPASELSSAADSLKKASQMMGYYIEGNIGPTSTGEHFDIKRVDRAYFDRAMLDQYVRVNGNPLSSGVTVPGGRFGAPRSYGKHAGWDYAFGAGEHRLELMNGAEWTGVKAGTANGDLATFRTPDGSEYQILHGKFIKTGEAATGLSLAEYRTSIEAPKEPFLTNPMAVGIGADPLGAKQMMFDVNRQAILESYNATNEAIAQQSALMERRLELASEDAMTREHILELEERDRDVKEGLAELEKSLQAEYKAGNLLQEDIQQQLDERIVAETRLTAAMLDRQEAERKKAELQELNARLYEQAQERMARINEQQAQAKEYADRLTDGFTNLAIGVVSGAASMEQALGQLFNTILSYLANQAFQGLFGQLFGGLFGVGGGGVALTGRDIASGFLSGGALGFANGGVISGGFRAFADGGVVNKPTLGLIGEGSMNEAVVPLPNGRAIPVEMRGGGTNITVNVNNPGTGEDGRRLGKQISEAIKAELVQQSRVGGLLRR